MNIEDRLDDLLTDRNIKHHLLRNDIVVDDKWVIAYKYQGMWLFIDPTTKISELSWLDDEKLTFKQFKREVDHLMIDELGMGINDVEDYDWMAEYESENSPSDSFKEWKLINNR